jgi:hypothetical protein
MRRSARFLALLLAVAIPVATCLATGTTAGHRSATSAAHAAQADSRQRPVDMTATDAADGPLAVLPARADVDDRDAIRPIEAWRVLALVVAIALLVAVAVVVTATVTPDLPRDDDVRARWVRFRAPPAPRPVPASIG